MRVRKELSGFPRRSQQHDKKHTRVYLSLSHPQSEYKTNLFWSAAIHRRVVLLCAGNEFPAMKAKMNFCTPD